MPAIVVDDVSKRFKLYTDRRSSLKERVVRRRASAFDEFWALRDVSLTVPRGSTYGLIGSNGSGKSTLLKMMAGIHRPTSGAVSVEGRVSALLELGAGFHPELSGRENVQLNGSILGLSRRQIDAAMDDIVSFSGLEQFIDTPVKVYSSGMYVRLGFAIAVNLDPEVLIIDEIIAVGDEEFQRRCFDHLYELRRRGVTIVFVSHSLPLVQTLCDHVAWLDHGRLREQGPALEVVDAYLDEVNAAERERIDGPGQADEPARDAGQGRRGSQELLVSRVEFLDAAGRARPLATAGEPLTIRVHYDVRTPVDGPVVGLAIHHENGVQVTGPNTRLGGLELGRPVGPGTVDFRMDRLLLQAGAYVVTAAIVDTTLLHVYDYRDRAFALHVQPGRGVSTPGLVELPGRWSTRAAAAQDLGRRPADDTSRGPALTGTENGR